MNLIRRLSVLAAALATTAALAQTAVVGGHAHNDYEHDRPLYEALERGFKEIESDVFLVFDELFVAHDSHDIQFGRTLQSLYLDPLRERIRQNGGSAWPEGTEGRDQQLWLAIDVKTGTEETWAKLDEVLSQYGDILTSFGPDGVIAERPVVVIISGNRARDTMLAAEVRYAAYDGRMGDLESDLPAHFIPLISDNWNNHFEWRGEGEFSAEEREKLQQIVDRAHADGRAVRFWATPDMPGEARENIWRELVAAGVDLINTDHLADGEKFLLENR